MVNNFRSKWMGLIFLILSKKLSLKGYNTGVYGYTKFRASPLGSKRKGVGQDAFGYRCLIA